MLKKTNRGNRRRQYRLYSVIHDSGSISSRQKGAVPDETSLGRREHEHGFIRGKKSTGSCKVICDWVTTLGELILKLRSQFRDVGLIIGDSIWGLFSYF